MGQARRGAFNAGFEVAKGRYATAYHDYIDQPEQHDLLQSRRTAIEPIFDLVAKVLGTTGRQKQLPVQRLDNVRTCLALATLTVQVAMIASSIWGLPLRNISTIASAFTYCGPIVPGPYGRGPRDPSTTTRVHCRSRVFDPFYNGRIVSQILQVIIPLPITGKDSLRYDLPLTRDNVSPCLKVQLMQGVALPEVRDARAFVFEPCNRLNLSCERGRFL